MCLPFNGRKKIKAAICQTKHSHIDKNFKIFISFPFDTRHFTKQNFQGLYRLTCDHFSEISLMKKNYADTEAKQQ